MRNRNGTVNGMEHILFRWNGTEQKCHRFFAYTVRVIARVSMHYTSSHNNIAYVRVTTTPYPGQNGFFSFFEGLLLEAPWAVLFHATATHCHHGTDALFFILEWVLQVLLQIQSSIQPQKFEKRTSELNCPKKSTWDKSL